MNIFFAFIDLISLSICDMIMSQIISVIIYLDNGVLLIWHQRFLEINVESLSVAYQFKNILNI